MTFLGNIISGEEDELDPREIEAVKNLPRPLTPTDIKSFLGLTGYYPRFMDDFASIASPLTALTEKSKKFEWSETCEKIFKLLKATLTFALVLTLSECTKGFVVYYDASQVCLGVCLCNMGR